MALVLNLYGAIKKTNHVRSILQLVFYKKRYLLENEIPFYKNDGHKTSEGAQERRSIE